MSYGHVGHILPFLGIIKYCKPGDTEIKMDYAFFTCISAFLMPSSVKNKYRGNCSILHLESNVDIVLG